MDNFADHDMLPEIDITPDIIDNFEYPFNYYRGTSARFYYRRGEDIGKFLYFDNFKSVICARQKNKKNGKSWILVAILNSGDFLCFNAFCHYEGFESRGGVNVSIRRDWKDLWDNHMTNEIRSEILKEMEKIEYEGGKATKVSNDY